MNNFIKSIFISVYITLLAIVSIHSVFGISELGFNSVWLGVAIAIWPTLLLFMKFFIAPIPCTSANLNFLLASSFVGTVLAFVLSNSSEQNFYAFIYASGLGVGGILLYVFWYSRLGREKNITLENGKKLPEFQLKNSDGASWSSSEIAQKPTLMMFFRGNWCPLCMAQIKEVAASYQKLDALGVEVFLISPQPEKFTKSLANKFDVNFRFMVDEGNKAASLLGIESKQGTPKGMEVLGYDSDTVLPTVILTDKSGMIIFTDQTDNYRVRPEPETFLRVFSEHKVTV